MIYFIWDIRFEILHTAIFMTFNIDVKSDYIQ